MTTRIRAEWRRPGGTGVIPEGLHAQVDMCQLENHLLTSELQPELHALPLHKSSHSLADTEVTVAVVVVVVLLLVVVVVAVSRRRGSRANTQSPAEYSWNRDRLMPLLPRLLEVLDGRQSLQLAGRCDAVLCNQPGLSIPRDLATAFQKNTLFSRNREPLS